MRNDIEPIAQWSEQGLIDAEKYQRHIAYSEEGHRLSFETNYVLPCSDPDCPVRTLQGKNALCLP